MKEEIWKDIPDYEGLYQASSLGRIKSLDRLYFNPGINRLYRIKGKILTPTKNTRRYGYYELSLYKNGSYKRYKVHRLVALTFLANPNGYPQENHIDGNKANNTVDNLEWCTATYNINHALRTGLANKEYRMVRIQCVDTGEVFESVVRASKDMRCDRRDLFKSLKANKPIKGHSFRRITEEEYQKACVGDKKNG